MNLHYGYIVAHTIGLQRNWILNLPLWGHFWKICPAFSNTVYSTAVNARVFA